jgi:iron complex transport system ATP-binding protein
MNMIRTADLSIGYRRGKTVKRIQQGLNLHALDGELIALVGPNGCGKSTLLRTLAGLQEPVGGTILLGPEAADLKILEPTLRARLISLVLTDTIQLGYITVEQLVAMGRHPYTSFSGKMDKNDKQKTEEAIRAVRLEPFRNRLVSELSDGERQRVMIAKALTQDTPIILLDEPTSFLDLPNRVEIMLLLKKLVQETRKCILISTHEIDLAIRLADTLWLMESGKDLLAGAPSELTANGSVQAVFHGDSFGFDPETGRVIFF